MTISADVARRNEHRISVVRYRVACPRVGTVELDRCRECVFLLRLEAIGSDRSCGAHVVCMPTGAASRSEFEW